MKNLKLEATSSTPRVDFDGAQSRGELRGACYPENAADFFQPLFEWLKAFEASGGKRLELEFRLDYFNTSSSKRLLDLFDRLDEMQQNGVAVTVRWYYSEDDIDLRESGEEFADGLGIDFNLVAY